MTDAGSPPPHRPTVPPLGPVIEGVVVADSLAGVPGANLAPTPGPVVAPPPGVPVGPAPEPLIQQPVLPSFIWGAVYGFLARTLACLLSIGYIAPVNGMFTALLRSVNGPAGVLLLLAEFFLLGGAAVTAVVIGLTLRPGDRRSYTRALFFGRVYFWATCWYLATIVIASFYTIGWDTLGGGIWLLILGLLNVPSLVTARKIITRTRWAGGRQS